jgi:outer membrane protein assembly factor BamD
MRIFLILITSIILFISCSKKGEEFTKKRSTQEEAISIYKEGLQNMKDADYFYASKKFSEAEALMPQTDWAAKSSLMSSYCLYAINFYDEAILNLERFIQIYPASEHVPYAHYLIAISYYEQILDEKWIAAINRLKIIVDKYDKTIFVEEALHRLVEIYYKIGLEEEAKAAAVLLGYNYQSSEWYQRSYKVLNKDYKPIKVQKEDKDGGLIKRTIKKLLFIDDK